MSIDLTRQRFPGTIYGPGPAFTEGWIDWAASSAAAVDLRLGRVQANVLLMYSPAGGAFYLDISASGTGATDHPVIILARSRGTLFTPANVQNNDVLGIVEAHGHDGTADGIGGKIEWLAAQNWAVGAHGTKFRLLMIPNGTTVPITPLQVSNDGITETLGRTHATTVVTSVMSPYNCLATDHTILVNSAGGAITINLPTPADGREIVVKVINSTNNVTLDSPSGNVEAAATVTLASGTRNGRTLVSDGTDWWITGVFP